MNTPISKILAVTAVAWLLGPASPRLFGGRLGLERDQGRVRQDDRVQVMPALG